MQRPLVIRYTDDEDPSGDGELRKLTGVVTRFSSPGDADSRGERRGKQEDLSRASCISNGTLKISKLHDHPGDDMFPYS